MESGGNSSEDLLTSCSFTSTTPDITNAWAFVRDAARPRLTRSLSMRSRCTGEIVAQERACQKPDRKGGCHIKDRALPDGLASETSVARSAKSRAVLHQCAAPT